MRRFSSLCALTAVVSLLLGSVSSGADVAPWFTKYSHVFGNMNVRGVALSRPEFLPGTTRKSMHCDATGPVGAGTWSVLNYDRAHRIALAVSNTDACTLALFVAPPPPGVTVPNADLSRYATGRGGIRIGSSYAAVAAAYGKSPNAGKSSFIAAYTASLPGRTVTGKPVALPESLEFYIDSGRVTAIDIYIDLSGES